MHTTALDFPLTVPPRQKPTPVIGVLPKSEVRRVAGAALNRPQSRWTVVAASVLSILLHVAAVAIVEMDLDRPPAEVTQAVRNNPAPGTAD